MTEDEIIQKGTGICIICGRDLQNNVLEIPDAQKVINLILEAYNQQRTILKGPELWACHDCCLSIATNAAKHAKRFNDAQ
jgi:hypothetical protein